MRIAQLFHKTSEDEIPDYSKYCNITDNMVFFSTVLWYITWKLDFIDYCRDFARISCINNLNFLLNWITSLWRLRIYYFTVDSRCFNQWYLNLLLQGKYFRHTFIFTLHYSSKYLKKLVSQNISGRRKIILRYQKF